MEVLGIIAGGGPLPILVAKEAATMGKKVVAVAHSGETDPNLAQWVNEIIWIQVGQVESLISFLKDRGVSEAIFLGGIDKSRAMKGAKIDSRGMQILARLMARGDDTLLGALARELEDEGICIIGPREFLQDCFIKEGVATRTLPSSQQERDVKMGIELLHHLGPWDVGQTVVVKEGVILAVEAIEGTDRTIERAGRFGGEGFVVVKGCKPHQDERFDLPVVGPKTISLMASLGGTALAVEAQKTIILQREMVITEAEDAGISLIGWKKKAEDD